MKSLILSFFVLGSIGASAQTKNPGVRCRLEMNQFDESANWGMAGDTNQEFELELNIDNTSKKLCWRTRGEI